jgi:hypothetical protein
LYSVSGYSAGWHNVGSLQTVNVTEFLRTLKGRNRACLVKADDGRYFVRKFSNSPTTSNWLFNEAFASQLGAALTLPFASWSKLRGDPSDRDRSSFGSELIPGDILEYLPGGWYRNIQNRYDIYRCLLFDLWCNHTDPRQAIFQLRPNQVLYAYFVDHDQMFSAAGEAPLLARIARTRYIDLRIYNDPPVGLFPNLRDLAEHIGLLAKYDLHHIEKSVPASWGTIGHRKQTISDLKRRALQLSLFIEAILQFANDLGGTKNLQRAGHG